MATDKKIIKDWFRTGLKPTQAQFWAWMDSYWHKDEKIPITAIDDIETIFNEKADAEALTNHLTDANAHAALFDTKEDKTEKGEANGYVPLNEYGKIASQYLGFFYIKSITGASYNVTDADNLTELVYNGTVAMNVIIPNNATLELPIGTVFYTVATNSGILSISGGLGVVFQTVGGLSGIQNEIRRYIKRDVDTWGIESGAGGGAAAAAGYALPIANSCSGDFVYFGTGTTIAGNLYQYSTAGSWVQYNGNASATSIGLLAIAQGTTPSAGMMVKGYARYAAQTSYSVPTVGAMLFGAIIAGTFSATSPTASGNIVRIVGFCIDATNDIIYFNPDNTWVVLN